MVELIKELKLQFLFFFLVEKVKIAIPSVYLDTVYFAENWKKKNSVTVHLP